MGLEMGPGTELRAVAKTGTETGTGTETETRADREGRKRDEEA